jgi:hypothetical protein
MAGKFTAGVTIERGHRAFTYGDRNNSEKFRLMESFSVTVSHDPAKSYIQKVACIQEPTFRRSTRLTGKISVEKLPFGGKKNIQQTTEKMNITEQHAALAQYPGGFPETTWRICTVALRSVGHRLYSDLAPPPPWLLLLPPLF